MPECNKCHQVVIWNSKYFDEKRKADPDLDGLSPILNEDGSEHACEGKSIRNYVRTFYIIPGYEYIDFHGINLLLGNRIDGFLSRGGIYLCRKENQKIITLKIQITKKSLPFQLKYISKPFLMEIKAQDFSQYIKEGDHVKVKCSKKDHVEFTKEFTNITLRDFIGFNYCLGEFKQYKILNLETMERLKPSKIVLLLLKNKGIDLIGDDKQLIMNEDKKEIFEGGAQ